jgi:hypothetical protein
MKTSDTIMNSASQPRFNLVLGAIVLSGLLTGTLALGTFLSLRFQPYDPRPWFYLGGPIAVLFISFVVRLYRWCGWKHLCLSLPFSLGIALLVFTQLFYMGFNEPEMYIALGVLIAMILLPGLLGMSVGFWASQRANTVKCRRTAVLLAIAVVASVPVVRWIGWRFYAWCSSAHAETVGKAHLRAEAGDLKHTDVVPTLDTPIIKGTNLIWCATFQVAWNELSRLVGEDISMDSQDPSVALLNRKAVSKEHLDEATYFVEVSATGGGSLEKISEGLNDKFNRKASPELLAAANSVPAGSFIAYSYLFANLPFEWAFERHDFPLDFGGTEVESFGIAQYLKSQEKERLAATQLFIYYTDERPGVVIELKTRRTDHHLYLALIPPLTTLEETAQDALSRVKGVEPSRLEEWSSLIVPVIDFDLTREYAELTGKPLRVSKLDGMPIGMATQQIRFKLDERGAILKSEAIIAVLGSCPELVFNKPFLVLLQYQDNEMPYFAAWIDNAELLVK